jgi:hypothetical protein
MRKRWMVTGLFGAGVVTGGAVAEWQLDYIVSAQARWSASRSRRPVSTSPIGTSSWRASTEMKG